MPPLDRKHATGREPASVLAWTRRCLREDPPRARSLIITIFGDSIAPYREGVWLGDLIRLLSPFAVSERLVRTSVYRLSQAGWLAARRHGRRSYYTLAPGGERRFRHAYERVYTPPAPWRGGWVLAILPKPGPGPGRARLRRELEWEGFASPVPGVLLRPADDDTVLREVASALGMTDHLAILKSCPPSDPARHTSVSLLAQCWNLAPSVAGYTAFQRRFAPLLKLLDHGSRAAPQQCFVVQTLLIDAFRRAALHDPRLPAALLPADWPGDVARRVCGTLYRHLYRDTRVHLAATLTDDRGPVTESIPQAILRRFGGLG